MKRLCLFVFLVISMASSWVYPQTIVLMNAMSQKHEGKDYVIQIAVPEGTNRSGTTQMMLDGNTQGIAVAEIKTGGGIAGYVADQLEAFHIVNAWKLNQGLFAEDQALSISGLWGARRTELVTFMSDLQNKNLTSITRVPIINYQIGGNLSQIIDNYNKFCSFYFSCDLDPTKLSELSKWTVTTGATEGAKFVAQNVLPLALKTAWNTHSLHLTKFVAAETLKTFTASTAASIFTGAIASYIVGQALEIGDFSYLAELMNKSAATTEFYATECLPSGSLEQKEYIEEALYGYLSALFAAQTHFEYTEKFWTLSNQKASGPEWGNPASQLQIAKDNLKEIKDWKNQFINQYLFLTASGVRDGHYFLIREGKIAADSWRELIKAQADFSAVLDVTTQQAWLGSLKAGEAYAVKYTAADGYHVTGNDSQGGKNTTGTYKNANPDDNEISLWGRVFSFDDAGQLFDKQQDALVGHLQSSITVTANAWRELIKSQKDFSAVLDATTQHSWLGSLKAGETYTVRYTTADGYHVTGDDSYGGKNTTGKYKNANPDNNEISLWGRIFSFDDAGQLFDKQQDVLVGHLQSSAIVTENTWIARIKSQETFTAVLDAITQQSWLGSLKAGETYTVRYTTADGYHVTGNDSYGGKNTTAKYKNANPDNNEISLWGRVFKFNANGELYDKQNNVLVGHLKTAK